MLIQSADIPDVTRLVRSMRHAAMSDVWRGQGVNNYFRRCRTVHRGLGMVVIFTRDEGYHSSGWWKNPDYERCFHLSLTFFDVETKEPMPRNRMLTAVMLDALFGNDKRWLWCEPPYTDQGKQQDVWHYRLFCDQHWQPIMPRGEVYSRELTEAGWKSFSEVQASLREETHGRKDEDY